MGVVASHVVDSSHAMNEQGKYPSEAEYSFSIRNTDARDKSMGMAKNVFLDATLPKAAKLKDAYFYLEAKGKEDPASKNCKLTQDDGAGNPTVRCEVPSVKEIVDVYVRAHYDGDQKALEQLAGTPVDVTLHEGHEVLTTTKV